MFACFYTGPEHEKTNCSADTCTDDVEKHRLDELCSGHDAEPKNGNDSDKVAQS